MEQNKDMQKISRRKMREYAFKLLFSLEFEKDLSKLEEQVNDMSNPDKRFERVQNFLYLEGIENKQLEEHLNKIYVLYLHNNDKLTQFIKDSLKETWTINRLDKASLTIIKLAIIEMKYLDLDYKIAINEALELSKKYSDHKQKAFVNGILATYVKNPNIF